MNKKNKIAKIAKTLRTVSTISELLIPFSLLWMIIGKMDMVTAEGIIIKGIDSLNAAEYIPTSVSLLRYFKSIISDCINRIVKIT